MHRIGSDLVLFAHRTLRAALLALGGVVCEVGPARAQELPPLPLPPPPVSASPPPPASQQTGTATLAPPGSETPDAAAPAQEQPPAPEAPPQNAAPVGTPTSTPQIVSPPPVPAAAPPAFESTSGYRNGLFYLRTPDDVFRIYVQGRVHVDHYSWLGPGLSQLTPDQALKDTFLLRRARFELAGEFFQMWQWHLSAEFGTAPADNSAANTAGLSCSVNATTSALTCSNRESTVQSPDMKPAATDVFVNFAPSPWANVQVGQFYLPFTMENRISDNTSPFLERSLAVRSIGAPLQRDIGAMFWGEAPDRTIYYAAGVFNGDGPNRTNADDRYDFAGRVMARPLVSATSRPSKWTQIGASVHAGSRDPKQVGYDMPSMTTQEGFTFWKPTYTDSAGRLIHIIPSGTQWAVGADVYVPFDRFDFTAEIVYADYDTREAVDGLQLSPFTERLGDLKGYGYYAEVGYWLIGDYDIIGYPTYQRPLHVDLKVPQQPARHGLQVLGRFEQLGLAYQGSSRGGVSDSKTPDGNIDVTSFTLGVNYWATRHLRVSVNYGYYLFPNSEPTSASTTGGPVQTSAQRAVSPAQNLPKGVDNSARDGAHDLHEISARVGVQF